MKEFTIAKEEAGQRLHKYLARLLPNAGTGFTYKMLRKKNITLNHSRAEGSEMLSPGDVVTVFFSDETFAKMSGAGAASVVRYSERPLTEEQIVYEDEHLMAVFKPAGVLSQKDDSGLESLNEQALQYLMDRGDLTEGTVRKFKPGICNRLDRNTAGIVWFAKTLAGAQGMAEVLRNRNVEKYYFAFVAGILTKSADVTLYLTKDEATNTVTVSKDARDGASVIHTGVWPVASSKRATLVRIRLYTGKSHQIRSVMKYLGFPVLGDPKYMPEDKDIVAYYRSRYHLHGQQLFAYAYRFPEGLPESLSELAGETITGLVPDAFAELLAGELPANQEGNHGYLEIPRTSGIPV